MRKPTICIGKNKGADQLHSNCEADQRLCFRYMDSTISLRLLKPKVSRFWLYAVTVQPGLCRTWLETQIVCFLMRRLNLYFYHYLFIIADIVNIVLPQKHFKILHEHVDISATS